MLFLPPFGLLLYSASAALLNTSSHQSFAHGVDDAFSDQQRGDLSCLERKVWAEGRGRINPQKSKTALREGAFFMYRNHILRDEKPSINALDLDISS